MSNLFSQVLNMSMTGSVVILLVMLARFLLKRSPKIFSYALWSVVLFRLLCPVAFTAPVSVLDVVEPEQKETSNNTSIVTYIPATVNTQADFIMVQPDEQQVQAESITKPEEQIQMTPMHAVALVWSAGMAGMMLYSVVQYLGLRRRLVGAVQLKGNIYLADHIDTAFVVGLVQPRIYLPSAVPHKERYFILAHEQHHIRRGDHIIKLLAYLALCIHWFNPLVWLAFVLAGKDMEMSCDEAVIKSLGPDIRADYSASLLRLATHKKILSGMPLAFGEGNTKGRVLNMAKWKKPRIWISIICLILCIIVLVICAVNPSSEYVPIKSMYGESLLGSTYENLTQDEYTAYLQTAYGLDALQNHLVYHNAGSFQIDFQFSENTEGWQLESARKFAYEKFYLRNVAQYDLWEYDVWLIEHISEVSECVMFRIFVDDQLIMMGSYPGLNPAELKINDLPEGYYYEIDQNQNIIFTDGLQTVGGITSYPIPDGIYDPEDESFNWLKKMVIPDYEDPNLYYLAGITSGNDGWAADFADELDEAKRTVYRHHTFQVVGDTLYDIWFDRLKISFDDDHEIRKVISIPQPPKETESNMPTISNNNHMETAVPLPPRTIPASEIATGPDLVQYGTLKMRLPSNMSAREQDGEILLVRDGIDVGGITCWTHPGFQPDHMVEWIRALGIPELQEGYPNPIAYMAGGSLYGSMEIEISWDGNPLGLNEEHQFFIDGNIVYDVWYDQNLIPDGIAERFLKTVAINAEPASLLTPEEQAALEKCKAVLDTVQSGSHHIAWEKTRTSSAGTSSYRVEYLSHGENWLHITGLQTEKGVENQYRMKVGGEPCYGVVGVDRRTDGNPAEESQLPLSSYLGEPERPWLSSYQWDESTVAYVDTLQEDGMDIIMLRIDEPFSGYPEETESYAVDFFFDGSGSFLRVKLTAFAFRNNDLWTAEETETIYSLDPERINTHILAKYDSFSH